MKRVRFVLVAAGMLAMARPGNGWAQSAAAFARWAKIHAHRLPVSDTVSDVALEPLGRIVGKARVVGYGEPTHGAHEPLAFRNRLFRFLVEHRGFTAIALESGFTESYRVYQIANGGDGDLGAVVRQGITWGMGEYPENEELVGWIRRYNMDPAHRRKVHIYGMDLSGGDTDLLRQARGAVDFSVAYLARRDSAIAASFAARFRPYLDRFSTPGYDSLSAGERSTLTGLIGELRAAFDRQRPPARDEEFGWASRSAASADQLNRYFLASPPYGPTPGGTGNLSPPTTVRDSSMAENVRWALEREGAGGKILVYAHNNHIMNSLITGGIWTRLRLTSPPLGMNLRRRFGHDVVLIGSAAVSVSGGLPSVEPDSTGLDAVLSQAGKPRFVIDLREGRSDPGAWAWLGQPRSLHAGIMSHVEIVPRQAYDALVYLGNLSPVRPSHQAMP